MNETNTYNPVSWKSNGLFFERTIALQSSAKRGESGNAPPRSQQIFYKTSPQQKEAILLLHGFPTSSYDWAKMWDRLVPHAQVICLDFLGFGFSEKPFPHQYSIFEQVKIVADLLAHLKIGKVHILAHDYAVSVAQEAMAQQSEKILPFEIASVCFLNGGMFSESYHPRLIQKLLLSPIGPWMVPFVRKSSLRRNFKAIFGKESQPSEMEIDEFWNLIIYNNGKRVIPGIIQYLKERQQHNLRWTKAVVEASVPCRLINGPEDPISGNSLLQKYRTIVPKADTVELAGIGHYPNVEAPAAVTSAYLEFLNQ